MRITFLIRRSLLYYWRTNLAVVGGVAVAVAVLAGALTVGVSVRASLRDLALRRLGNADHVLLSPGFFREQLDQGVRSACTEPCRVATAPVIAAEAFVTAQASGRRASRVQLFGVDDRFWALHDREYISSPSANDAFVSADLARELETSEADSVVVRVEQSSDIPTESLHGRKEDVGRTVRLTVRRILPAEELGEFTLTPRQGSVRAVFVSLARMQALLQREGRVNAVLFAGREPKSEAAGAERAQLEQIEKAVRAAASLDDLGLRVRELPERHTLALESAASIVSDDLAATAMRAAQSAGMSTLATLTYLANTIRAGDREVPYSVITALDLRAVTPEARSLEPNAIVLNDWIAGQLNAKLGDVVSLEYYIWESEGRLSTHTAEFRVAGITPMRGLAADRNLTPDYPGMTDADRIVDWDPPFPIDLGRIRPVDEAYWNQYRTTPKAFVSLEAGQRLWRSRFGAITSLRIVPPSGMSLGEARRRFEGALREQLDPFALGFSVYGVREQALAASEGSTDFGEYFTYFSTFLVVSALLLAAMFFRLGIEQRLREIGLLQALGLDAAGIRRLFLAEGAALSLIGGLAGIAGAVAYGALIVFGLSTWWVGAVGTSALTLHLDASALAAGAIAGIIVAALCIWWSLRSLARYSSRALLHGETTDQGARPPFSRRRLVSPVFALSALAAVAMIVGAATELIPAVVGFFGAGTLSLVATVSLAAMWLTGHRHRQIQGTGWRPVLRLGVRNATYHPGRSVLCIALIAAATFVIVSVEAFKKHEGADSLDRRSGNGGYPLVAESLLPIVHDLNDAAGREALNLPVGGELQNVRFERFRIRPGDDASCLNLYQPKNPRIVSAPPDFLKAGRFAFQRSLAETADEQANPWLLLNRTFPDGAIPVIADANSMTYVLHLELGEDIVLPGITDRPVRLRLVAALADSIFQSELVMAESYFVRTFPERDGYRFFLVDTGAREAGAVESLLETRLSDFGVDVGSTTERLAAFHRVEYTYLSTFQMLGGLGLVLGTLGLGAVLLRNVLERRRELALLRALGYREADFFVMVIAENAALLIGGLAAGTLCALLAIAPMFIERGARLPISTLTVLLLGVLGTGLLASLGATVASLRAPLLPALRAE